MTTYSNLPLTNNGAPVIAFDTLYTKPLEIDANEFAAITGFFTSKGFDEVSSESVAVIIIRQARADNFSPMKLIDTLTGLTSVELSALIGELINFNRFKTSFLGRSASFSPNAEVARNIIP